MISSYYTSGLVIDLTEQKRVEVSIYCRPAKQGAAAWRLALAVDTVPPLAARPAPPITMTILQIEKFRRVPRGPHEQTHSPTTVYVTLAR